MHRRLIPVFLIGFTVFLSPAHGQQATDGLIIPPFQPVPVRQPAFPLKTERSLYQEKEVLTARSNIKKYASAAEIQNGILKDADYWLGLSNAEILRVMPDARVPRGFDLCAKGCPVHGDSVFKVGGFYPWIIDPKKPFKVKCPIGGETYPHNDFSGHYEAGLPERKFSGQYEDDGYGWVSPQGDRYWFVAYANQWLWCNHVIPGILALSRAYLLTEDERYAERATFMLYRLAEVYPSMDHENQSRYGLMQKMKGVRYSGKILNRIWETQLIRNVAESYDHVWNYIDKNRSLQQYAGKSGQEIRAFIEANVLEDGLDAIESGKISGNFGMHQNAMLYLHLVRQNAGKDAAIEKLIATPAKTMANNGLEYALYNQVFRDGMPLESPDYNSHWLKDLVNIADVVKKGGRNLFEMNRMRKLLDAPLELAVTGKFTPDWGDSGNAVGKLSARYPETYHVGYGQYRDPRYLYWIDKSGDSSFTSFGSLFMEALPEFARLPEGRAVPVQPSRLFAGYGLGVLNNKADKTALAFTYGMHYSHYHWDFLNIELFANGQKMMPDLGYPDAMNAYVAPVYTWSSNTISHNTTVVDEKKQNLNLPGQLHLFNDGKFARVIDGASPAYKAVTRYRRNLVMVDTDPNQSYVVDFFHVAGGNQHDYALHGPPGAVIASENEWTPPAKGTFAGTDVALEEIYDDEKLKTSGSQVGYGTYGGSGFQHLFNVRQKQSGTGKIEYRHQNDPSARLRLHTLTPDLDGLFMADAYDRPRAKAYVLKYLVARRKSATASPLKSTFVSVMEPYQGEHFLINQANLLTPSSGNGHYVVVERPEATDIVLHDTTASVKRLGTYPIETDAVTAVITTNKNGELTRAFFAGGTYLKAYGKRFQASSIKGKVEKIDAQKSELVVQITSKNSIRPNDLANEIAFFANAGKRTAHPVKSAVLKNRKLIITTVDDLLIGKLRLDEADKENLRTQTSLTFQKHYNGVYLLDPAYQPIARVAKIADGKVSTDQPPSSAVHKGDVLWLSNVGPGDTFEIPAAFSWEKR
ncbi:heparinase II/III domain-containing protein [Ravibacter arvi]|uniref:heparinase II/III domain-containing protein n=1 Tax=Ravibacter arvi TaxID=2051041 RepID=UPI0031F154E0